MADAINQLPPGFGFHPSDKQLLSYYLTNKNNDNNNGNNDNNEGHNVIKELDLLNYEPFQLPQTTRFSYGCGGRKKHWFCYTAKVSKERRIARGGYWRKSGRVRNVMSRGGNVVLGTKTSFVFYSVSTRNNVMRTNWVMDEYALANNPQASFVLCRVFVKSRGGNRVADNVRTSGLTDGNMIVGDFLQLDDLPELDDLF